MEIEKGLFREEHIVLRRQIGEERILADDQLNLSPAHQPEIIFAVQQNLPVRQRLFTQECAQQLIQKCRIRAE